MSWLRIDDSFDTHPKILGLGTDQRRWTWQRILIYTCRHGASIVPPAIRDVVPKATPAFLHDCVNLGLLDTDENGSLHVHNWAKYQAGDPKKAARQRRWRREHVDASVDADVDADVDGQVDAPVDASRVGARARPVPSQAQPGEPEGSTAIENPTVPVPSNGYLPRDRGTDLPAPTHALADVDLTADLDWLP